MKGGRGPRLDQQLYASIRARHDASLSEEVDGLVRETSALLTKSASSPLSLDVFSSTLGSCSTSSASSTASSSSSQNGGSTNLAAESPVIADLRKAMKMLEQKEADLELAAKIGDALFQENSRLRKENQGSESLRDELDAREDELIAAKEELRAMQRRSQRLLESLQEADATNQELETMLEAATQQGFTLSSSSSRSQSPPHSSVLTSSSEGGIKFESFHRLQQTYPTQSNLETSIQPNSKDTDSISDNYISGSNSTAHSPDMGENIESSYYNDQSNNESPNRQQQQHLASGGKHGEQTHMFVSTDTKRNLYVDTFQSTHVVQRGNRRSSLESTSGTEELDIALASVETWRKRALAAERELETERKSSLENDKSLQRQIESLRTELARANQEHEKLMKREADSQIASMHYTDLEKEVNSLRKRVEQLQLVNDDLRADLDESQAVLGAQQLHHLRSPSEGSRGGPNHLPSLETELQSLDVDVSTPRTITHSPPTTPSTPSSEEVDMLYFHFHMTAMTCLSQLSKAGAAADHGHKSMISKTALNTINTMDTKEMYKDAIARNIPPHHWIGYIRDSFAQAHLKSLLKQNAPIPRELAALRSPGNGLESPIYTDVDSAFAMPFEGSQSYLEPTSASSPQTPVHSQRRRRQVNGSPTVFQRLLHTMATSPSSRNIRSSSQTRPASERRWISSTASQEDII